MLAILLGMRLSHTRILLVLLLIMLKMFIALWCVPLPIMPWLMLLDMGPLFMFLVMRFRLMFLHVMLGGMVLGGMGAMMRGWSFHFVDDDSFPLGLMGPGMMHTALKYQARRQNKCHCHKLHTVTFSQSLPIRNI